MLSQYSNPRKGVHFCLSWLEKITITPTVRIACQLLMNKTLSRIIFDEPLEGLNLLGSSCAWCCFAAEIVRNEFGVPS